MENTVIVKASPWKIIKRFLLLLFAGIPVLIFTFGEPQNLKTAAENLKEIITTLYLLYVSALVVWLVIRLYKAKKEIILQLEPEGITIHGRKFFPWNEIYDFRTATDVTKIYSPESRHPVFGERKYIIINDERFEIKSKFLKFSVGELAEIIKIYKERNENLKIEV